MENINPIAKGFKRHTHIDELPFTMTGGIPDTVVYIRNGHQQYWKSPNGGWDVTSYYEIQETIDQQNKESKSG